MKDQKEIQTFRKKGSPTAGTIQAQGKKKTKYWRGGVGPRGKSIRKDSAQRDLNVNEK